MSEIAVITGTTHGIGRVTVMKRGALSDSVAVSEKWKLNGSEHRFVIVTRQCSEQVAVIGERLNRLDINR